MPIYHGESFEEWDKEFRALWGDAFKLEQFCGLDRLHSLAANALDSVTTNPKIKAQCKALIAEIDHIKRMAKKEFTVDDTTESELSLLKIGMMLGGAMAITGWTKSKGRNTSKHWQEVERIFLARERAGEKMTETKLWSLSHKQKILPPSILRDSFNRSYKRKVANWRKRLSQT